MLHKLAQFLIQERLVAYFILLNSLTLFLDAFPAIHQETRGWLSLLDHFFTLYFLLEIVLKIRLLGFSLFWRSGWNQFDFWVVLCSAPAILSLFGGTEMIFGDAQALSVLLLLRIARLIKFFRLLRFTPNGEHIWAGIMRSLKASVSVFLAIFLLNLLFAMGATLLFREWAPEYFGNPMRSWYSLFKVFTVEGWYEVPDLLYERSGAASWALLLRLFYIMAVFIGGILGFALANAVFVDEMTSDNTDHVEYLVQELAKAQDIFRKEVQAEQTLLFQQLHAEIQALRAELQKREP